MILYSVFYQKHWSGEPKDFPWVSLWEVQLLSPLSVFWMLSHAQLILKGYSTGFVVSISRSLGMWFVSMSWPMSAQNETWVETVYLASACLSLNLAFFVSVLSFPKVFLHLAVISSSVWHLLPLSVPKQPSEHMSSGVQLQLSINVSGFDGFHFWTFVKLEEIRNSLGHL